MRQEHFRPSRCIQSKHVEQRAQDGSTEQLARPQCAIRAIRKALGHRAVKCGKQLVGDFGDGRCDLSLTCTLLPALVFGRFIAPLPFLTRRSGTTFLRGRIGLSSFFVGSFLMLSRTDLVIFLTPHGVPLAFAFGRLHDLAINNGRLMRAVSAAAPQPVHGPMV